MNNTAGKTIELLGSEIYYLEVGEGVPILILHGWGIDHRLMSGCMELVFDHNCQGYKRIYIDLPGMGQSKTSSSIRNSDDMLEVILSFIEKVIQEQRFLLVGESYGGYLAMGLLHKIKEQLLGLFLLCPGMIPGYRLGDIPPHTVLEKDEDLLNSLTDSERRSFEFMTIVQTKEVWERYRKDIYDSVEIHLNSHFLKHVLDGAFSYDVTSFPSPYDRPSLILLGKQDTEVGYKDQFKLLDIFTRASYVVLDKAGHNLQIEQEELFVSLVKEWLRRVSATV